MDKAGFQFCGETQARGLHADVPGDVPLEIRLAKPQRAEPPWNRSAGVISDKQKRTGGARAFDKHGRGVAGGQKSEARVYRISSNSGQWRCSRFDT